MSKHKGDPGYRAGWCIHYRAPNDGVDTCEAGVRFDKWHQTPFVQRPCFLDGKTGESKPDAGHCDLLRRPTAEEIKLHEGWAAGRHLKLVTAMAAIEPWREANQGKGAALVRDCPVCGAPMALSLSIAARNGHVHGHCKTEGCVSWIE